MTRASAEEFVEKVLGPGARLEVGRWVRVWYPRAIGQDECLAKALTCEEACQQLLRDERVRQAAMAGVVFEGTCLTQPSLMAS